MKLFMMNSEKKVEVYGLIEPKENYTSFKNTQEKLDFLKSIGMIAPKIEECKQFFYNGIYSKELCKCEIVGYVSKDTLVIELDNHLHCINTDCLKDMQPLAKEIEVYQNSIPLYTDKAEVKL